MRANLALLLLIITSFGSLEARELPQRGLEKTTKITDIRLTNLMYRAIIIARKRLDEVGVDSDQYDVGVHVSTNHVELEFSYFTTRNSSEWSNYKRGCGAGGRPVCKGFLIEVETMKIVREWDFKN